MIKGKWNGFNYEYPNGVTSPYRIEIKSITVYGEKRYLIEYHDGTSEDKCEEEFYDGSFISNAIKFGKVEKHNGEFTVYRGFEYDYRLSECVLRLV